MCIILDEYPVIYPVSLSDPLNLEMLVSLGHSMIHLVFSRFTIMERNFLWLGVYHIIQLDTKNQSFPNMQEKSTSNTNGYRIIPCSRRLK